MLDTPPLKIYHGTWSEIINQQHEIPPDALLEVKIYQQSSVVRDASGNFDGKSVAALMREIGFVEGGPSDLAERAEDYLTDTGFGETDSLRTLNP